ncbi:MAG: flagellar hook-length control protein FliK, partial [Bdellovibrionota bacterium]
DFVSDKVATLQAAGGGTLRVGLDTKDMGQIEIKVTMRAGRVDVKISGESPEITRQLEAGRSELTAKLEKHVELGDLNISRGQFTRVDDTKQLLASSGSLRLSEDLVKNSVRESVETLSRLTDNPRSERLESLRNTSPLARSQESSSTDNGFARDERREQALEQWANSSQMRQSA